MKSLKPFLIFSLLCFLIPSAQAQLTKGTVTVGGSAWLGQNFITDQSAFNSNINPQYGIFVSDRFLLGSSLSWGLTIFDGDIGSALGISPFLRCYFNPEAENNYWFAGLNVGTAVSFSSGDRQDTEYLAGLNVGLSHFLRPNIALEGIFGGNVRRIGDFNFNSFNLGASLRIFLGPDEKGEWRNAIGAFQQGSILLGASSFGFNIVPEQDFTSFFINPNVGYFITNEIVIGLQAGISVANRSNQNITTTMLTAIPFARYYFFTENHLCPFISGGFGIVPTIVRSDFGTISDTEFEYFLSAGADLFISPQVALEGALLFSRNANVNAIGFNFGFLYFINKGEEE